MKKVTLKDIAKELGVTVGTVSHVLNGIDDISLETKEKVLDTAKRLGYISNSAATSLRSGKTNTIAIIIPDISNPHIAHQIKLIEDKLRKLKYSVIIMNTNEDEETEYKAIITACSKQVDGILLCPSQHSTKNIEFLNKIELPFILIGRYFKDCITDYVCADDVKGGYIAGKHLLDKGLKNPLYIGAFEYVEASVNRFDGLKKAFSESGINISDERFIKINPTGEDAEPVIYDALEKADYDCIVAFSDLIAFKTISYMKLTGKKFIPIIGFDAIAKHMYMPFNHTSVGMIKSGWADTAATSLIEKIKGTKTCCKTLIDVEIFEFKAGSDNLATAK